MFSKEESRKLREEFWIAFGKSYPKKWMLYKTGNKALHFKFHFDLKCARVSLDIDSYLEQRIETWEKLISLQSLLVTDYLPDAIFKDYYLLENQKEISRVYVEKHGVSIHNKDTWQETMIFLYNTMLAFEDFYNTYKDILK